MKHCIFGIIITQSNFYEALFKLLLHRYRPSFSSVPSFFSFSAFDSSFAFSSPFFPSSFFSSSFLPLPSFLSLTSFFPSSLLLESSPFLLLSLCFVWRRSRLLERCEDEGSWRRPLLPRPPRSECLRLSVNELCILCY